MAYANSIINSNFSEIEWVTIMKKSLQGDNMSQEMNIHCCIFRVPKSIKDLKPESYTPQRIAFGPYHHFRPGPYMAQKFKLEKIKTLQMVNSSASGSNFEQRVVDKISEKLGSVRAYYNEQLQIRDATLSWIIVIDGLFLLELIKVEDSSELVDSYGRKSLLCSLWKDAMMIENQIPYFVLEQLEGCKDTLARKANAFCEKVSPIESNVKERKGEQPLHLLHLLYKFVCFEVSTPTRVRSTGRRRNRRATDQIRSQENTAPNFNFLVIPKKFVVVTTNILHLLGLSYSIQAAEEKALIPSASELSSVKVKFRVSETKKGVNSTEFKKEDPTLVLPILTLTFHSDVVIRNLLAYEAITMPDSPIFNRYIELMTAMIRTTEDVHLLKKEQILKHEGEVDEVVKLFEGFKDCVACEGKTALDGVVKEINEHYKGKWKIKYKNFLAKLVDSSRKKLFLLFFFFFYILIILDILYVAFPSHATFFTQLALQQIGQILTNLFVKIYPVYLMIRFR